MSQPFQINTSPGAEHLAEYAIVTKDLSRTYQTYKKHEGLWNSVKGFWHREIIENTALKPTNLQIKKGQIIGLVGANGAGKTTLLKLLSGLIYPSSGDAWVLGSRPWTRSYSFLSKMSILLGQKAQLWWDLPPADSYDLLIRIYDVDEIQAKQRIHDLAEMLQCTEQLHVQLRRLSLGERMKMEIIGSLIHQPEILFLDEPTIGLDVMAQSTIRSFLENYVQMHKPTVILTSHYMDDISRLADQLLLISQGAIVYNGTVDDFMASAETVQKLSIKLTSPLTRPLTLLGTMLVNEGTDHLELEIPAHEVGRTLNEITRENEVQTIHIEEVDFEEVIHKFLEKESRGSSNGHSFPIGI